MSYTIKASQVTPGMLVEWKTHGIYRSMYVSQVARDPDNPQKLWFFTQENGGLTVHRSQEVTVVHEKQLD